MSTAINRMQFLRGDYSGKKSPIRPPWADTEKRFTHLCDSCGECIKQCPTQIIQKGRGDYPVINFNAGECLFCNECVDACKTKALTIIEGQQPWSVTASINTKTCLAYNNTECRSCYDPCEVSSINMTARIGGVSIPLLNTSLCTGCGACFAICPTKAITMITH
ncbi:MAG: ferredoxin-type protein NapF [Gammaproteobacteria bacterium]|nr:ferredoxin-type protein NapF [Gammaproteobacteria bacterium]